MEWSSWSECSVSCGVGVRTRHLQCINLMETDEPCPITETEHVERRPCKMKPCFAKPKYFKNHKQTLKHKPDDFLTNVINVEEDKYRILKKHRVHEGESRTTSANSKGNIEKLGKKSQVRVVMKYSDERLKSFKKSQQWSFVS